MATVAMYVLIVLAYWFYAGRAIGRLSGRLVELERQINQLADSSDPLLKWEAEAQKRRCWLDRLLLGKPLPGGRTVK